MDWTSENLEWFFKQPTPRQVDETLLHDAVDVFFPKIARVVLYILPVLMLSIMGFLITFLVRTTDITGDWRLLTEPTALSYGRVLHMEKRKGSKGSILYVYRFEFKPGGSAEAKEPPVKGVCFSGSQVASPEQQVSIEYLRNDPKVSRIQGCRLNPIPLTLVIAMPLIGAITGILPIGIFRYKRKWLHRLLAFGVLAPAVVEKVKPGPKGALVVYVRYNMGGAELKSKTNVSGRKEIKGWLISLAESGECGTILVDPDKPKSFFLLDLLLAAKTRKGNRWS
jgi:hypothetical protein